MSLLNSTLRTSTSLQRTKILTRNSIAGGRASSTVSKPHTGLLTSILHGSQKAKDEGEIEIQQHGRLVGRNKYVHELITHRIKPDQAEEYKAAAYVPSLFDLLRRRTLEVDIGDIVMSREKYFTGLIADPAFKIKLTGSWETVVGELDTYVHILEHDNYESYDSAMALLKSHPTLPSIQRDQLLPTIQTRNTQLLNEFKFWHSSPPRTAGGIFEMRSYRLRPGSLLEWEAAWRRGIEARKKFVQPAGAWFAQVGELHEVHHLWQYPDMATRKATREQAWNVGGWADTVQETVKLAKQMKSTILTPCDWSPLK